MALSPQLVHDRLEESIRRLRWSRSSRLALIGAAIALLVLVVALLADAYFHFGPTGRWIGLSLIVVPLLGSLGTALRVWLRPISAASVARRIEGVTAGSQNVLISALQFDRELPPDSLLRQALFAEMNDPFPQVRWRDVFDIRLLQKLGAALGVVAAALLVWACVSPAHFTNSAARLFLPASQIAPLTRTQFVGLDPGNAQISHGSDFSVRATLGGQIPQDAWVVFREAGASWQRLPMNREVGQPVFTYHWKEVTQPMALYVVAGDTRSAVYQVAVRAKTAIRTRVAEIEPPSYTQAEKSTVTDFTVLRNVVPGSRVTVKLAFNYPLTELRPSTDGAVPFTTENVDGTQWQIGSRVAGNESVKLTYRDTENHVDNEAFQITVKPDEPPKIQIVDPPEGKQLIADPSAVVDITFTCTDDFGLQSVALYRSTEESQAGELVQEWPAAAGQRTFTGNAKIPLRQFKSGSEGRLSFVLLAKDHNDVTGPGTTFSRPIVVLTRDPEQVRDQADAATAKLQKSLEGLIKLQQTNLEESRGVTRLKAAGAEAFTPVLTRQIEIGDLGRQLAGIAEGGAPPVRLMLKALSENEMKDAVLTLRNAASAPAAGRPALLAHAVDVEQVILARLQGSPDLVKSSAQLEQLKNVLSGLEDLLKQQRELHRDTQPAVATAAAALSARQDALADEAVQVRAGLVKTSQTAALADRDFNTRLVQAATQMGELKINADMLAAAEELQAQKIQAATGTQARVIANLSKILALLNEARMANAAAEIGKLKDVLDGMKDKLGKLENIQRDIIEKSKEQAHKDELDPNDRAAAQEIKASKDLMAKVVEQMLTDAHIMPDIKSGDVLRSELVEIYEDVIQADKNEAAEGKLKANEVAVQKEDGILQMMEKAKKIADDMEMWLPTTNDTTKWVLENFDKSELPEVPMLPLHDFTEDLVGKLLDEQKGLQEKADDASSNQSFAENDANGNAVTDGPQGSFGAQGRSGNQRPNKNEQTGRSSGGRQGESNGEMAGDTTKNLEGSEIDARRSKDAMQKGQIKDEDGPTEAKATGGGKAGAFSDREGMDGNAPLRGSNAPRQKTMDALAVEQALLREKAAKTKAQATLLFLRANGLDEVVQLMDHSAQALKDGRFREFNGLHQKIVQRLTAIKGNVAAGNVVALPTGESVHGLDKQMAAGEEGAVPAQYQDAMADYYRSLVQGK